MINKENYKNIVQNLPKDVCLVAVSKTKPIEDILELYELGQREFGENKVQELTNKIPELPKDIKWHLIGPLQRNKVNKIVGNVELIQTISSQKLLEKVARRADELKITQNVLIQINISDENIKNGILKSEIDSFFKDALNYKTVNIKGIMAIGKNTSDESQNRKTFKELYHLFQYIKENFIETISILSMGMSSDYQIAIEEKSNMIRVGSAIFGKREENLN